MIVHLHIATCIQQSIAPSYLSPEAPETWLIPSRPGPRLRPRLATALDRRVRTLPYNWTPSGPYDFDSKITLEAQDPRVRNVRGVWGASVCGEAYLSSVRAAAQRS